MIKLKCVAWPIRLVCQTCRVKQNYVVSMNCTRRKYLHISCTRRKEKKVQITPDPPSNPKVDWIGPPDLKSNIRPYKFHIPDCETVWQKEFRLRREDNRKWNHDFWLEHNETFFEKKEEFINTRLDQKQKSGEENVTNLSPEELSQFYREFLDNKFKIHMQYNKEWYKRNISLLWPAFKVNWEKLWKRKDQQV